MFPLLKYTKEQIESYFAQVTPEMVKATLGRGRLDFFDLLNLISPAAYPFMDAMRARAQKARRRYYGKTVSVYAPLYIGNTCVNSCRYCDFRIQHTGTVRRNLSLDEIRREAEAIRANGTAAEIEIFPGLPHGFGLGEGTVAEGWIQRAAAFWERQCK